MKSINASKTGRAGRAAALLLSLALLLTLSACGGTPRIADGVLYTEYEDHAAATGCDAQSASPVIMTEYMEKPVTEIGERAFTGSAAKEIVIPASVTDIAEFGFMGSGLESVLIPETVERIGDGAFMECASLAAVTVAGAPSLGNGVFKDCTALRSAVFTGELQVLSLNVFEGCAALREIHVPRGCAVVGAAELPDDAVLYLKDRESVENAIQNGWRYVIEEDDELAAADLPTAAALGLIDWSVTGQGDTCYLDIMNVSDRTLALTLTPGDAVEADGTTYFILNDGYWFRQERVIFLDKGQTTGDLPVRYFFSYGPENATVEFAADGEFTCFVIYGGALEAVETVMLSPYGRQSVTLPCGRYGFAFAYGGSEQDALDKLGTPEEFECGYRDFEARERYEVSVRKLAKNMMQIERFGEYGPETSSLLLRAEGQAHCYKLVRVGGDVEFSVLLSAGESRVVSFPCGRYVLRIAQGDEWISDEEAFGPEGEYSVVDYFTYEAGELYQITATTVGGNVGGDSAAGFAGPGSSAEG